MLRIFLKAKENKYLKERKGSIEFILLKQTSVVTSQSQTGTIHVSLIFLCYACRTCSYCIHEVHMFLPTREM